MKSISSVILVLCLCVDAALAVEPVIEDFEIQEGVIEYLHEDPEFGGSTGWRFITDGREQKYAKSLNMTGSSMMPGLPGLSEFGFVLKSGSVIYRDAFRDVQKYYQAISNPKDPKVYQIFLGFAGQCLLLKYDGATSVFRLDVTFVDDHSGPVMWNNASRLTKKEVLRKDKGKMSMINIGLNIDSAKIQVGTLQPDQKKKGVYLFKMGRNLQTTMYSVLEGAATRSSEHPASGLAEVGCKLGNGVVLRYEGSKANSLKRATREYPNERIVARILEGAAHSRVEVQASGETSVLRVEIERGDTTLILWKNREKQREE